MIFSIVENDDLTLDCYHHSPTTNTVRRHKRVSFQPQSPLNHSYQDKIAMTWYPSRFSTKKDTKHLWYSERFQLEYIQDIKTIINGPDSDLYKPYRRGLKQAWIEACNDSTSMDSSSSHPSTAIFQPPGRPCAAVTLVGLERTLVQRIRVDKKVRRSKLANAILRLQDRHQWHHELGMGCECGNQCTTTNNNNHIHNKRARHCCCLEQDALELAQVSREISRPSRIFARHLAQWTAASF